MAIYEFAQTGISALKETSFSSAGMQERRDLQRLLRENVKVIAPETLVIAEEFADWEGPKLRIDLLAIDKEANLVVIELKRTEDGGHMDLQAIRYAAMVSRMTFDKAVEVFGKHLKHLNKENQDSWRIILEFLDWIEPTDGEFAQDVRIVLASAEFSKELTSSVLWLNEHDMDIRCVRLKPYSLDERILADVQQIIPLPEAAEYQVQIREKTRKQRQDRTRAILPRMAELMEHGIVKAGEKLSIKNFPNSEAAVIDSKMVKYKDQQVPFNEWGTSVTNWPAINIYDWAINEKGETLSERRAAYMRNKAA